MQADGSAVTTLPYPKAAQPDVAQLHQLLAAVTAAPARQAIPCMQAIACGVGKHAVWITMSDTMLCGIPCMLWDFAELLYHSVRELLA